MKSLSGASLLGRLLSLPTNIRLGWPGWPVTNALAYYEKSYLTAVKSFITLAPADNVIKPFYFPLRIMLFAAQW